MSLDLELKFVCSPHRVPAIAAHLRQVLRPDPVYPRAHVETIYFDTERLESVGEKVNSDYLKTKFRLRWYIDPSRPEKPSAAFAEVKRRIGGRRRKLRRRTRFGGAELRRMALEDPTLLEVPAALEREGVELPGPLYPLLHLRYERRRFVDPLTRARVSLDSDIALRRVNRQLLSHVPVLPLEEAVVEVKGPHRGLPPSLRLLPMLGCRRTSFSKYGVCFAKARSPLEVQ